MTDSDLLKTLYIAKPCDVNWEDMTGNERVRDCSRCTKRVYNISNMTKKEAEDFLVQNGETVCLGFFRRRDGTIMTDDCPVGLRKVRNGLRSLAKAVATFIGLTLFTAGANDARVPGGRWGAPCYKSTSQATQEPNTIAEACSQSESILIAEYLGYVQSDALGFFNPPTAYFRPVKSLKGSTCKSKLALLYEFHEQLPQEPPVGWKFSDDLMPKKGDKFVLFIKPAGDGSYETYHGSFGRLAATDVNLTHVYSAINGLPEEQSVK